MQFNSKYDIGQTVYMIGAFNYPNRTVMVGGPATIGQIQIKHTESPGRPGEELFDNYKPQKSYEEKYMLVETGIGTGTVWDVDNLFLSHAEAKEVADHLNSSR